MPQSGALHRFNMLHQERFWVVATGRDGEDYQAEVAKQNPIVSCRNRGGEPSESNSQHFPTYLKTHTTLQRTDVGQVIISVISYKYIIVHCSATLAWLTQVVAFGIAALSSFFNGSFPACQRLPTGPPLDPVLFNGLVCLGVFLSSLLVPFLFNQAGWGGLKLRKRRCKTVHQLLLQKVPASNRSKSAILHDLVQSPQPHQRLYSTDVR